VSVRVIIDTNVLVSGIFFAGLPGRILHLWKNGQIQLVASSEIFHEYAEIIRRLGKKFPGIEITDIIDLLAVELELVRVRKLKESICRDPDDDKFIACALTAKVKIVITGDKDLLDLTYYKTVRFISPSQFLREAMR
jgi:putative PIN family toxin of toxin-antitoxin system